jgi:hypothetical protein
MKTKFFNMLGRKGSQPEVEATAEKSSAEAPVGEEGTQ